MEEASVVQIPIDDIIPNRFQPRLKFNEKELQNLAESISSHGIVSPIIVRKISDKYEIIAGERRYKAANMVGLTTVPCIVRELTDDESAEIAIIENLQRSNLTPIEEARSYQKLLSKGITQEELAKKLGVSQPTIANKVRLLNLTPEVQDALLHNKISERHARSLLSITDPDMQNNLLNTIITNRLTVRQTDIEVGALLGKNVAAAGTEDIFNVNIDEVKSNSEDIIKKVEKVDFDSLLKQDVKPEEPKEEKVVIPTPDIIRIDDFGKSSTTNSSSEDWINPFQQQPVIPTEPEPTKSLTEEEELQSMNEYLNGLTFKYEEPKEEKIVNSPSNARKISTVINATRDMKAELENAGIEIETEEFDFNDMYQIIIKVKKD